MAAPALAASMADCAICSGVTGTAGLRPSVSADPVTAHEIMTLRCMPPPCPRHYFAKAYSEDRPEAQRFRRNAGMQAARLPASAGMAQTAVSPGVTTAADDDNIYIRAASRRANQLLKRCGLPPIVHCAKPFLRPSLERI